MSTIWPSLTASLSLRAEEIEKLNESKGSQQERNYTMLSIWASREGANYGQLCEKLKTIPLSHFFTS